jgi:hypothetical protein
MYDARLCSKAMINDGVNEEVFKEKLVQFYHASVSHFSTYKTSSM